MNRGTEFILASLMAVVLVPVIALLSVVVLLFDGRPVFFVQSRMKSPDETFKLVKFRTLTVAEGEETVLGGDKLSRITPLGRILRKSRMDELPQLWNILRGDIGFVGPRPPLRRYMERFPEVYNEVLKTRPGVTGLATLRYHAKEERLMAQSRSAEEAEALYERLCIPAKARLDLLYAKHKSPCLDLRMMLATIWRRLSPVPRPRRRR